ncbi:MAG TPA: hypothetical protein VEV13_07835 [Candidatus Limnocylindria bacterium]|nr:hypothetical protein [Candidatus Limnocylindria bacterium]
MAPSWAWVIAAVALVLLYLRSVAGRLDRLHVRLEAAESALDAQLVRRAAAAGEVAHSGLVDPATAVLLADAAHAAQTARRDDPVAREASESALSFALRAALDDAEVGELARSAVGRHLLDEVRTAGTRVVLARRFHNDAVRATLRLRRRRLVRWFRLAGTASWPRAFEFDDAPPAALA